MQKCAESITKLNKNLTKIWKKLKLMNFKPMESTITERISTIIKTSKMNINSFSQAIGVSQSTINGMFKAGTEPSYKTILAILNTFPLLSAEWLLRGEGEMFKGENVSTTSGNGNNVVNGNGNSNINQSQGYIGMSLYRKLVKAIIRVCPTEEVQDKIIDEIEKYMRE